MSDFMSRNILPELWNEILKWHWTFFNTEECIQKLETRKNLEDRIKEFLCIVQHDRKFFLSETEEVFRKSIQDMKNFSAQNAINAFEAISTYANNIFTKPWRKEYRILKMYSGFYQHEIISNLLDADKLFEAMGYRRFSENTLILDCPICPDQVANVSRDAMTAYVELQIIKYIHTVLDSSGIKCSWLDIFRHREKYTGSAAEAIKDLTKAAEKERYRSREKALANDNYGYIDVQPMSNYLTANNKPCPIQCHCHLPPTSSHRQISLTNGLYCLPEHHQHENFMYSNITYPAQRNYHHFQRGQENLIAEAGVASLPQMSHSRSLEHYSEPSSHHQNTLPHRHSFDHQQQGCTAQHQKQYYSQHHQPHNYPYNNHTQHYYESPYDCIDKNSLGGGSSSISYAVVAANACSSSGNVNCNMSSNPTYSQPYNVSGNRFPLPLNISNQISAYDCLQASNFNGSKDPTYAHIGEHYVCPTILRQSQNSVVNSGITHKSNGYNYINQIHGTPSSSLAKDSLPRQQTHQSEQLISFDDSSAQQQIDSLNSYEGSNNLIDKRYMQTPVAACQHFIANKTTKTDDLHVYAKPTPKENRKPLQNPTHLGKLSCTSEEREGDATDISYESAKDLITLTRQNERNHQLSPTQFSKNQDGVGSFESWNYVFQNLDRSGYSKDLGDREDLFVQSLDLDSLNINNDTSPSQTSSAEKKRSNYAGNENKTSPQYHQQHQMPQHADIKQKGHKLKNSQYPTKNNIKMEISASSSSSISNTQKQKLLMDNKEKKIKSALKQTNATSKSYPNFNKAQPKNTDNKSLSKTLNNNNNNSTTIVENGTAAKKKSSQALPGNLSSKKSSLNAAPAPTLPTQIIVTGTNEWSCEFCTFINPNTKRICEMCCRTKDNKLDASTNPAAAGRNTVAHNTTCA